MELKLSRIKQNAYTAFVVSHASIIFPYFLGVIEIVSLATFLLPLRPSSLTTDHMNKLKYLTAVGILVAGRDRNKYEN
jgi:hypothetical protein